MDIKELKRMLTRTNFEKWLRSRPAASKVGNTQSCPIEFWVKNTPGVGRLRVLVNTDTIDFFKSGSAHDSWVTPAWAARFISKIDVEAGRMPGWRKVTASMALKALK